MLEMRFFIIRYSSIFNNNDKRTCEFINQIKVFKNFNFRSGLQVNIPLLAGALNVTDQDFYNKYQR